MSRLSNPPRSARKPSARSPVASAAVARLPHPSWRLLGETATADRTLSAEDFWQKLGL
ncbi:hypothetical protein [Novosphingobium sp.]|uniref:hypothetical protein n=1 Tax=Novosphingobium sp. TaxID=1874826 RepID=UPI002603F7E5|nr:hypothetical protein [Novosphingobium sp.]